MTDIHLLYTFYRCAQSLERGHVGAIPSLYKKFNDVIRHCTRNWHACQSIQSMNTIVGRFILYSSIHVISKTPKRMPFTALTHEHLLRSHEHLHSKDWGKIASCETVFIFLWNSKERWILAVCKHMWCLCMCVCVNCTDSSETISYFEVRNYF